MAAKKLRVYELARELNLDNSEVIRELQHMGVPVTSHSNTVEDRLADQLRKKLGPAADEEPISTRKNTSEEIEEAAPIVVAEEAKPEPAPAPAPKIEPKPAPEPVVVEAKPVEPKPAAPITPPPAP